MLKNGRFDSDDFITPKTTVHTPLDFSSVQRLCFCVFHVVGFFKSLFKRVSEKTVWVIRVGRWVKKWEN